jgi:phosphosulfolactate synthase (CoM biosynthesis protein A)
MNSTITLDLDSAGNPVIKIKLCRTSNNISDKLLKHYVDYGIIRDIKIRHTGGCLTSSSVGYENIDDYVIEVQPIKND